MDIYNYISDCYNSLKTFIRLPSLSAQFCFVRDKIRKIWRDCSPPSKYSTDKYKHAIDTLKKELNSEIGVKLYFDRTSLEPLKDQSRKRFLSAVQNLYDELKQERVEDIREQYENIHKFLRIAIESPCYKKKENETYCKFLQSFCRAKFEKNVRFFNSMD